MPCHLCTSMHLEAYTTTSSPTTYSSMHRCVTACHVTFILIYLKYTVVVVVHVYSKTVLYTTMFSPCDISRGLYYDLKPANILFDAQVCYSMPCHVHTYILEVYMYIVKQCCIQRCFLLAIYLEAYTTTSSPSTYSSMHRCVTACHVTCILIYYYSIYNSCTRITVLYTIMFCNI
jgi:hypothetical protein